MLLLPPNRFSQRVTLLACVSKAALVFFSELMGLRKALSLNPKNQPARRSLLITYVEIGLLEEAKAEGVEVLKLEPGYTSKGIENTLPFKDQEVTKRWADALRLVGLERDVSAQ
jgi:hypothetical protein